MLKQIIKMHSTVKEKTRYSKAQKSENAQKDAHVKICARSTEKAPKNHKMFAFTQNIAAKQEKASPLFTKRKVWTAHIVIAVEFQAEVIYY